NFAPIQFQLPFARTAQPYPARSAAPRRAAGLTRQMRPHARQARQAVVVLRQFHLQRAFTRPRVTRKDVENERGAVQHLDVLARFGGKGFFNFALLIGRELVVKNHHIKIQFGALRDDFMQLAFANQRRGIDALDALNRLSRDGETVRIGEAFQFAHRVFDGECTGFFSQFHADKERALNRWLGRNGFGSGQVSDLPTASCSLLLVSRFWRIANLFRSRALTPSLLPPTMFASRVRRVPDCPRSLCRRCLEWYATADNQSQSCPPRECLFPKTVCGRRS